MIIDGDSQLKYSPVCARCQNLTSGPDRSCKAFEKIPDIIWNGKNKHTEPYEGDHSIRYQERKSTAKKASGPKLTMTGTDTRPDTDYDPDQLATGIKVEMEHTDDPEVAKVIAKTQLDEDPKYYSHEG
jgi:hypothetical protein